MEENIKKRILLIEDDEDDIELTRDMLNKTSRLKFDLTSVSTFEEGMNAIRRKEHDVYLLDYRLGVEDGLLILDEANKIGCSSPIIILTAQKNSNVDLKAMQKGACDYLVKGKIDPQTLERSIIYSLERKRLEQELKKQGDLLSLILESTTAGMCLLDGSFNIVQINSRFSEMFDISNSDSVGMKFLENFSFNKSSQSLYQEVIGDAIDFRIYSSSSNKSPIEGNLSKIGGNSLDCILSCGKMIYQNGVKTEYNLLTIFDLSKQKQAERKLKETHQILQNIVEKYGLDKGDPEVMADLLELEMAKIGNEGDL